MGWFSNSSNNDDELRRLEENKRKRDYIEDKIRDLEYDYNSLQREIDRAWDKWCSAKSAKDEGEEYYWNCEHGDLIRKQSTISYKIQDLNSDLRYLCN